MKIGSLFSGAGGLDMAVQAVFGGDIAWHCEYDKAASKILAHHYPDIPNLNDITQVNWHNWKPLLEVDVLCGGYPCQPFSAAGKRKGTEDDRHLWPYFAEAIRVLRPRHVILENVAGHRSMGFDTVLADLTEARYDAQWCSLRASDVGAPHRRERLFVLATDTTRNRPSQHDIPLIAGVPPVTSGSGAPTAGVKLLPTPCARDFTKSSDGNRQDCHAERQRHTPSLVAIEHYLPTPSASDSTGGGMHPDSRYNADGLRHSRQLIDDVKLEPERFWGKYESAIRRWEHFTRPAPPPTEPNKNGNPRLNAAFSEWMMGWPDGWVTQVPGISRNDQLRIIGNGVVPQQATAALHWLLQVAAT